MFEDVVDPHANVETPNAFLCGVCDTAMHFHRGNRFDLAQCSFCSQICRDVRLTCDRCMLFICCDDKTSHVIKPTDPKWKPSCYSSYFDHPVDTVRGQLYERNQRVSEFSTVDQQRWWHCMWHDIIQNQNRFRAELQHAFQLDPNSTINVPLVIQNLGSYVTECLVRLFIIFQPKLSAEIVSWFSSLIQHGHKSLGSVAYHTSVRLNGRFEQMKWLVQELHIDLTTRELIGVVMKMGRLEMFEYLLEYARLDISAADNYAIQMASRYGHLNIVERLLRDSRVDPSANDNYAIRMACSFSHLKVIERLLQDSRVDPSAVDNYAIREASQSGFLDVVERLLQEDRVDPTVDDNYPFRIASHCGHLNVVERLLQEDGVDPSADDNYAIRYASNTGRIDVVNRLLQDSRVDPSADENFAIRMASEGGRLTVVERLLQVERVDPSAVFNDAIKASSESGHLHVVERLLQDDRVDPSADFNFALVTASENGHFEVVERLLQDDRVDPSVPCCDALIGASVHGHLNIVKRLLQDDRVDIAARKFQAITEARTICVAQYLYDRAQASVCYEIDNPTLLKKVSPLHNDSLIIGGLCMSCVRFSHSRTAILPRDIIFEILIEWASLLAGNVAPT